MLLLIGSFCPIASVGFYGSITYFKGGTGDGVWTVVIAGIALVLVFFNRAPFIWITGLVAGGLALYDLVDLTNRISNTSNALARSMISVEWGWALIFLGRLFMIANPFIPKR